jgi:GT2 family glycosyltransferase
MITVGFSTRNIDEKFVQQIKSTCGIKDVEIIPFENKGTHSLTEAYNILLDKSKNDIVVLCHDDIMFDTKDWGRKILNHFEKSDYGVLGLAGTTHMTESGKWWDNFHNMVGIVNHQQGDKKWKSQYSNDFKSEIIETILLDGVFLVIHKKRIKNNFDENVKGFHFYDVDFSFSNHLSGVKVGVIFDVRITHLSIGQTNDEWEKNRISFVEKHKDNLPRVLQPKLIYEDIKVKLKSFPKVSVVIPTKNNYELIENCIISYLKNSTYPNYEIIIADTGSNKDILDKTEYLVGNSENVRLIKYNYYNFAKINNDVVKNHLSSDSEVILFSNNDIQILNDVISLMVEIYNTEKSRVGTIGCRLHYGDNTIQHSGISIGYNDKSLFHLSHFGEKSSYVYFESKKEVFGNTAALMMISKKLFEEIGGFNEDYIECFEDVELNVECLKRKKINFFQGKAVAYHLESQTRNLDSNKIKKVSVDHTKLLSTSISKNLDVIQKYIYKKVF